MSNLGTTPLLIDTGAFYARFVENAPRHDRAQPVFDAIQQGNLRYRPLYTSGYILSELATLILRKKNHETAVDSLRRICSSPAITVLHPDTDEFDTACQEFEQYDDQQISFVDQTSAVLARKHDVQHIFAFDRDFSTLGFTRVPDEISIP